jgi:hypothetical protein
MDRWLKRKVPDDANNVDNSNQQDTNVVVSAPEYIYLGDEIQFDPGA